MSPRTWIRCFAILAVALTAALSVASGHAPTGATVGGQSTDATEVPVDSLGVTDLELFMDVDATQIAVDVVHARLGESADVEAFAFVDKAAAYAAFSRIFADDPDLVARTSPDELPVSFRVRLRAPYSANARRLDRTIGRLPGVDEVAVLPEPGRATVYRVEQRRERERQAACRGDAPTDLEAYLNVGATRTEQARVGDAIRATPGVRTVRIITRPEALSRFRCFFRSEPDVRKGVGADDLPVSFEVRLAEAADVGTVHAAVEAIPGVETVSVRGG